jgi:hypothetical protein
VIAAPSMAGMAGRAGRAANASRCSNFCCATPGRTRRGLMCCHVIFSLPTYPPTCWPRTVPSLGQVVRRHEAMYLPTSSHRHTAMTRLTAQHADSHVGTLPAARWLRRYVMSCPSHGLAYGVDDAEAVETNALLPHRHRVRQPWRHGRLVRCPVSCALPSEQELAPSP